MIEEVCGLPADRSPSPAPVIRRKACSTGTAAALHATNGAKGTHWVEQTGIRILNAHRIMAISTVRPDGWPQTTIVGYANAGWTIYFMVYRSSQKLANIQRDDRISIAVGDEPAGLGELAALFAGGRACEVTEPREREQAWKLLMERHPVLAAFVMPGPAEAVMMRMTCKYVSALDYSQGLGHREALTVGGEGADVSVPAK